MDAGPDAPKTERLKEFIRRLHASAPAKDAAEAFDLVEATLNAVEDELTTIPFNPDNFQNDGRLYPPQADNVRSVEGHPKVKRYRTKGHNVFIGENGSIDIRNADTNETELAKAGADSKGVWDQ